MKYLLISTYCLIFILSACNKSNINTVGVDENDVIHLKINPTSFHDNQFSDLIEDAFLVQLETSSESLIGEIEKVLIEDDKIFVLDRVLHEIKIFNINGKYLGKIANMHRGPGGYYDISKFSVSKNGELIEIYDNRGFKFRTYNLNNEFVEESSLDYMVRDFIKLKNDKKIVYSGFLPSYNMDEFPKLSRLLFCNGFNIYQSAFEYIYSETNPISSLVGGYSYLSYYGDTIVFGPEIASFDIFHIYNDSIKKKYQIDFGTDFMPPINVNSTEGEIDNFLKSNLRKEFAWIYLVLESSKYLFVRYALKNKECFFLFDKVDRKIYNIKDTMDYYRRIDYGVPISIWDDTFITISNAEYFKLIFEIYKKQGIDPPPILSQVDENINENSNPVLSFIKFR